MNAEFFRKNNINFKENLSLKDISSFRIGGMAKRAAYPDNAEKLALCVYFAEQNGEKYKILGKTSNVLFSDDGYDGLLIFTTEMKKTYFDGDILCAECGASLFSVSLFAAGNAYSGMEFLFGIPGSVGGAVYMNGGAYGGEIKDILVSSEYFDVADKKIRKLDNASHNFSYRRSIFQENRNIILASSFSLKKGEKEEIKAKMDDYMNRRREKQPIEYPSAGSVFKRPTGYFAGELIEKCGLKGKRIGGAKISEKHAGFIINYDGATSDDVKNLIEYAQNAVFEKFGVSLEREIEFI